CARGGGSVYVDSFDFW
nr:immunoglobulin heavy chain junction region [Macaca mulatta]